MTEWREHSFEELAYEIMQLYIDEAEIPRQDLKDLIKRTYATFRAPERTPLHELDSQHRLYLLELWHGPTFAFKDVALQFLGNLFEYFLVRKNAKSDAQRDHLTVVGATSGDTGSAAIYGLRGKKDVSVYILFPEGRVSPIQEAQMTTVLDDNVHTISVEGTFDDCQDIVKTLFGDAELAKTHRLGAVNSINWARILAQITYYVSSWLQLQKLVGASRVRYVVPTGNFGDVLAGYYAKRMGLPVEKLVVATNANDILDRYFRSGRYEKHAASHTSSPAAEMAADGAEAHPDGVRETLSPAMDIMVSSNFERLLWYLAFECVAKGDATEASQQLASWMSELKEAGSVAPPPAVREAAERDFTSERVDDAQTVATIQRHYTGSAHYVLDPHTAVAVEAAERVIAADKQSEDVYTIALSTAHPAKFSGAVDMALHDVPGYSFAQIMPKEFEGMLEKERRVLSVPRPDAGLVKEIIKKYD